MDKIIGAQIKELHIRECQDKKLRIRGSRTVTIINIENGKVSYDKPCYLPNDLEDLIKMIVENLRINSKATDNAIFNYLNSKYSFGDFYIAVTDDENLRDVAKQASKHPAEKLSLEKYDVTIPEIDWLRKYVQSITAYLPNKASYMYDFELAFPEQSYKIAEGQWGWRMILTLSSDVDYDTCPRTLKTMRTNDPFGAGSALDMEHNRLSCAAYIWNLVKDYPEYFCFS